MVFVAAGGPPKLLWMDNGPELLLKRFQRFCDNKVGLLRYPPAPGAMLDDNQRRCK